MRECTELARLLQQWFPEEYAQRLLDSNAPQSEWVPIFVCSLSAPFVPTPLHIFEPRYRLMMRRCVESNQRFGMCLPCEEDDEEKDFADTGTMLFISKFEQLPDGRSLIETKGVSRFKVIERGELDGYSTALIQPYEEDAQGFQESAHFHKEALALHRGASNFLSGVKGQALQRLEHQLGPLPKAEAESFDAHMSFYVANLVAAFGHHDAELVFMQPERDRWQKVLQTCKKIPFFASELKKLPGWEGGDDKEEPEEEKDSDAEGGSSP